MRFIGNVIEKMQRHPKRVVFPEGEEPRILQAARQFQALRLGAPIVLGEPARIRAVAEELKISLEGIRIIYPAASEDLENFANRLYRVRREKGLRQTEAREAMLQPNFYGTMMLAMHQADGLISGASHITGSVLRPLFQIVRHAPDIDAISSCMAMEVEDTRIGENGVLFMADCGVIPEPNVEQLADIAVSTARIARHMLGVRPRVALLSFSTKGSASHPSIGKVQAATAQARNKASQLNVEADFDGELQADAALLPEMSSRRLADSKVAGRANVLIFPDLNSGNIASKLLGILGHASCYGQILLGFNRPAADISRGASAHDILGVSAIVGVQATDYQKLYPVSDLDLPGD
jgi:phosphate acetyltransferase